MALKGDEIWIQYNGTEIDFADKLVEQCISKKDIVIGFHEPLARQFTDFAVG